MPSRFFAVTIFTAAMLAGAVANAEPLSPIPPSVPQAPIGHLQPRAPHFSSGSGAEQVEQDQMSAFDAKQHKLDMELDKSLNICRC